MTPSSSSHYTFGDSDLAAARLERLAAAYAPSSAEFLRRALPERVDRAVDLGSGLGLTTSLIQDLTGATFVCGYERSLHFLELARARFEKLMFKELDVLAPPYPDGDLDLIYSRFLLTHLPEPQAVINACIEQLRPGGRLLLEEVANLSSPLPVLQKYYTMVGELQAHYGQELYVGRRLAALATTLPSVQVSTQVTPIELPTAVMAELHAMNIATWKSDPFMLETYGLAALEAEEAALGEICKASSPLPNVTCSMAQVTVQR